MPRFIANFKLEKQHIWIRLFSNSKITYIYNLKRVSESQEFRSSSVVLAQSSSCSCSQDCIQGCIIWVLMGRVGRSACETDCSHPYWEMASGHCWLLAGVFSSLPGRPSHRAAWVFSRHGSWLPPEQVIQEIEQGGIHNAFSDLVLEVTHCHFCHILLVRSESLSPAHFLGERN